VKVAGKTIAYLVRVVGIDNSRILGPDMDRVKARKPGLSSTFLVYAGSFASSGEPRLFERQLSLLCRRLLRRTAELLTKKRFQRRLL
jgi:hypothetical protein